MVGSSFPVQIELGTVARGDRMSEATKAAIPLEVARGKASDLLLLFGPACERTAVAGSIRREKPIIGDIEIVAIPKPCFDLLGEPDGTELDIVLASLCDDGTLERIKGGNKYKQYRLPDLGCNLDLFLVDAASWGCQFLIRTGPSSFSHRIVTHRGLGGWCPMHLRFAEGRLWQNGKPLETPEERDVFEALKLGYVEPRSRS